MKNIVVALLLISSVNIIGSERGKKVAFTETPANSPTGSIIKRTEELSSFDPIFEPKVTQSKCDNKCACRECLDKSSCELEKILNKLCYIKIMVDNEKHKDKNSSKIGISGSQAIAAARMIKKIKEVYKESKELGLPLKKTQDKKSTTSEKKSKKEKKEPKSDLKLNNSSFSRPPRLPIASDRKQDEERNQLTDSKQDSFARRLRQAGNDIP